MKHSDMIRVTHSFFAGITLYINNFVLSDRCGQCLTWDDHSSSSLKQIILTRNSARFGDRGLGN